MRTRPTSSSNPVSSLQGPSTELRVKHRPVLLHEVVAALNVQPDDIVVDATLGGGGHAREIVKGLGGNGLFIGFDLDGAAIERARHALEPFFAKASKGPRMILIQGNFRHLAEELEKRGITNSTKVLFDLGWSGYQLDSGRGFSFMRDEPLRMTYAAESDLDAGRVVNTWSESSLADIIWGFGGERYARRIAKRIVERRAKKPFQTSRELAEAVYAAVPAAYRRGKLHPATRTFQALRIAVNDELGALTDGLEAAWQRLAPEGRIVVISFHSLEDRLVKRQFAAWERCGEGTLFEKKPIVATREEIISNPRARSAKLRVIEKISYESKNPKNKQVRPLDIPGEP